jgi:hypothetical protein
MEKQQSGIDLIAAERKRQLEELGYDSTRPEDQHLYERGQLLDAASVYMWTEESPLKWPPAWLSEYKPTTHIRDLVKAGAMIAAEIDRLQMRETIEKLQTEDKKAKVLPKGLYGTGADLDY